MKTQVITFDDKDFLEFAPEDEMEIFELGQISVRVEDGVVNYHHDVASDKMVMTYAIFPIKKIREKLNQ